MQAIVRAVLRSALRLRTVTDFRVWPEGVSLLVAQQIQERRDCAKIVQLAGKADPEGSKKPAKDTPKVRIPPVLFFLRGCAYTPTRKNRGVAATPVQSREAPSYLILCPGEEDFCKHLHSDHDKGSWQQSLE